MHVQQPAQTKLTELQMHQEIVCVAQVPLQTCVRQHKLTVALLEFALCRVQVVLIPQHVYVWVPQRTYVQHPLD